MNCLICDKNAKWEERISGKKYCSKECQIIGNDYTKLGRDPQMVILLNLSLIELDKACMLNKKTLETCESKDFMVFYSKNRSDFMNQLKYIIMDCKESITSTDSFVYNRWNDYGDFDLKRLNEKRKEYKVEKLSFKKATSLEYERYWKNRSNIDRIFLKWVSFAIQMGLIKRTFDIEKICFALNNVFTVLKFELNDKIKTQIVHILGQDMIIGLFTKIFLKDVGKISKGETKFVNRYVKIVGKLGYLYPQLLFLIVKNSQYEIFENCINSFNVLPKNILLFVAKYMTEREFVMVINHKAYVEDPLINSILYYRATKKTSYISKYMKNITLPNYQEFIDFMVENDDFGLANLIYKDEIVLEDEFRPKDISKTFHDCFLRFFKIHDSNLEILKYIFLKFNNYLTDSEIERYKLFGKKFMYNNDKIVLLSYIENLEKDESFTYYEHLESMRKLLNRFLSKNREEISFNPLF